MRKKTSKKSDVIDIPSMENASLSTHAPSEKERLLDLYQTLKDLNVRSISDLENLIARTE